LKNKADSLCYQTKKQLEELSSKLEAADKEKVEEVLTKLELAVQNDDLEGMKTLSEELQKNMMEVGQKVYTPDAGAEGGCTITR